MSFCSKMVYSLFLLWSVRCDSGLWGMDEVPILRKRCLAQPLVKGLGEGADNPKHRPKELLSTAKRERREKDLATRLLLHAVTKKEPKAVDPAAVRALQQALQQASPDTQRGYSIHLDKAEQTGVGSLKVLGPPPVCFIQTLHYTSEKPSR